MCFQKWGLKGVRACGGGQPGRGSDTGINHGCNMSAARLIVVALLAFGLGCLVNLKFEPKPEFHFDSLVVELPALLKRGMEQQPALATAPAPQAVEGARPHPLKAAEKLFVKLVRHRVSERLQQDGFKLVGKNPTPLSKEKAEQLLSQLDDEQILTGAHEKGVLADGTVMDRLGALFDWILAHKDEILAVVKFVMGLLALFGDEPPANVLHLDAPVVPAAGWCVFPAVERGQLVFAVF